MTMHNSHITFKCVIQILTVALVSSTTKASSILLQGGTVIAFNKTSFGLEVHRDSSVLIVNDLISAIFPVNNPHKVEIPSETNIIDTKDKIVSPGFVDTHRHGWQTALKTLGSNTTLAEYFNRYGEFSAIPGFTAEDVYIGQLAGNLEALNAGVTTILDHAHSSWSDETIDAALNGSIDSGARVVHAPSIHQIGENYTIAQQIAKLKSLKAEGRYEKTAVTLGLSYDQFNDASKEEVESVIATAKEINASVVTTHYLGGPWGIVNAPSVLHNHKFLNTSIPIIFAHASFITPSEAALLRATNQYISITPESEMHYGHDHPYVHLIQDQASLGLDTHFTFSTDLITQARIWLQSARKTLFRSTLERWEVSRSNPMSVDQAFLLATRNGALALRRPDLGIIAVGAKADVVILNGNSPGLLGWVDPVAAVILHSNVGDIETVIVDGKVVKRDGKLVYPDYASVVQKRFLTSARKVQAFWKAFPKPVLEGDWGAGVPFADAKVVDVVRGEGNGYGQQFL